MPEPGLPLVSILTPSFNQGRYIRDCIESVANQTYPRLEHIVMDGGSTDQTLDVLRQAPPHVRWQSEPDEGQSHAINKALRWSEGSIIGWLNSDDAYLDVNAVAAAVECFLEAPSVGVAYGHGAIVSSDSSLLLMAWVPRFSYRTLRVHNFISQPTAFIRRSVVGEKLVDESFHYAMDRELWLRLAAVTRFQRLDRVIAMDRHHEERKSLTLTDAKERDAAALKALYGVSETPYSHLVLKLLKVTFRLQGASLIRRADPAQWAFDCYLDGRRRLLRRQLATTRAAAMRAADERAGAGLPR